MDNQKIEAIIKNQEKLSRKLENNVREYLEAARLIAERLKERKEVNVEFLFEIEEFIEHAEKQGPNENFSSKIRHRYMELIEEEKSLRNRIKEDLKRNNDLIDSIKKVQMFFLKGIRKRNSYHLIKSF